MEYTLIQNFIRDLSNAEQLQLFLENFFVPEKDATAYLPYINTSNRFCCGGYRQFSLDDALTEKIKPQQDSYISVNTILPGMAKSAENVKSICGVFIDIDINHRKVETETENSSTNSVINSLINPPKRKTDAECIELAISHVLSCIDTGVIPVPFALIFSGRGLAIHYRYTEPIPYVDQERVGLHMVLYQILFQKFRQIFENEKFIGMNIEVDSCVFNADRVCRLPGTKNTKAGKYARLVGFWCNRYHFRELCDGFGISRDMLNEAGKNVHIEVAVRKRWRNRKAPKVKVVREAYIPTSVDIPFSTRIHRNVAKFNLKRLDAVFADRSWVDGDHRHKFLFIYYNCVKLLYGAVEAYSQITMLNNLMAEPLPVEDISNICEYTDMHIEIGRFRRVHADGVYIFNPTTLCEPEWLDIPVDKAREYGFYAYQDICARREVRRMQDKERDRLVAELYLGGVTAAKTIARMIKKEHPELRCSHNTVKNVVRRLQLDMVESTETIDYEGKNIRIIIAILRLLLLLLRRKSILKSRRNRSAGYCMINNYGLCGNQPRKRKIEL